MTTPGRRHVVLPMDTTRLPIPLLPRGRVTDEEFHLIWSERTELSESAQQVRDRIIEEARAASRRRLP